MVISRHSLSTALGCLTFIWLHLNNPLLNCSRYKLSPRDTKNCIDCINSSFLPSKSSTCLSQHICAYSFLSRLCWAPIVLLRPADTAASSPRDANNRIKAELECASLFLHAHSSNTDVIAGSSSISLRGNLVIIPTPGDNGLLKQHWTE